MVRFHSLDALRATMMLLGLVLHSGASYTRISLGSSWPYQDDQTSVVFDLLLAFIHLFRMPAFFLVAGFFAALLYGRDGVAGFVRNRLRRVAIPLLVFWPLVPVAALGFAVALTRAGRPMFELPSDTSVLRQPLLGHLWFLYDLLIFYALAMLIAPLLGRLPAGVGPVVRRWMARVAATPAGVLLLVLITTATLVPMRIPGLETSAALLPPIRVIAAYGVFFVVGWFLYGSVEILETFRRRRVVLLAAGSLAAIAYLAVVLQPASATPTLRHVTAVTLAALATWLLILGVVGLFVHALNRPRALVRYLSDASYWIYLVHLAPTVWVPALLATSTLPAVAKFAIVLGLTTAVAVVSYHYFVRATVIGELLNGRRHPRAMPAVETA